MPVGTSPSFMSRLGAQMPGMVNSMAQDFGDPSMKGTVQGSSSLLKKQKSPMFGNRRAKTPGVTSGMPNGPIGTNVPVPRNPIPTGPTTPMPGMNPINIQAPGLLPSPEMQAEMPMGMNPILQTGPSSMPGFMSPDKMGPLQFNGMSIPGMGGGNGGGLFDTYNRMRNQVRY